MKQSVITSLKTQRSNSKYQRCRGVEVFNYTATCKTNIPMSFKNKTTSKARVDGNWFSSYSPSTPNTQTFQPLNRFGLQVTNHH